MHVCNRSPTVSWYKNIRYSILNDGQSPWTRLLFDQKRCSNNFNQMFRFFWPLIWSVITKITDDDQIEGQNVWLKFYCNFWASQARIINKIKTIISANWEIDFLLTPFYDAWTDRTDLGVDCISRNEVKITKASKFIRIFTI